jgi:hypothetical protein
MPFCQSRFCVIEWADIAVETDKDIIQTNPSSSFPTLPRKGMSMRKYYDIAET